MELLISLPLSLMGVTFFGVLALICVIAVLKTTDLLHATLYFSAFSFSMATSYLLMDAPDVGITEAAVGAGVSTVFILGCLMLTGHKTLPAKTFMTVSGAVLSVVLIGLLTLVVLDFPPYGSNDTPPHQHVAPYYLQFTGPEVGIRSVVAAVLASYRGYDTLGETSVIFTAGLCVYLLLHRKSST